ncbi:DUF4282 domain-containing protein [Hafnia alvei]|uniref:DUF4282 domain-containing protein n=1 Tax=Hafnia alvei TaxID=569 RepID=UPI001412DBAE|nr:DUF4282 domain-containing protein [Hafnia alvei]QIP56823.1 DUF4282 domain-containing protein [Hafnia alvei]
MFSFDKLITPKIISFLYAITVLFFLAAAVITFFNGKISVCIALVVIAIFCRIFFEAIMISFKNNEYLRRIVESLESQKIKD